MVKFLPFLLFLLHTEHVHLCHLLNPELTLPVLFRRLALSVGLGVRFGRATLLLQTPLHLQPQSPKKDKEHSYIA